MLVKIKRAKFWEMLLNGSLGVFCNEVLLAHRGEVLLQQPLRSVPAARAVRQPRRVQRRSSIGRDDGMSTDAKWDKPEAFLKSILKEMCTYIRKGDHQSTWVLKRD